MQYLQPFLMIGFSVFFLGESVTWLTIVIIMIVFALPYVNLLKEGDK